MYQNLSFLIKFFIETNIVIQKQVNEKYMQIAYLKQNYLVKLKNTTKFTISKTNMNIVSYLSLYISIS